VSIKTVKIVTMSQVWWCTPVISATWETEAGGSHHGYIMTFCLQKHQKDPPPQKKSNQPTKQKQKNLYQLRPAASPRQWDFEEEGRQT
jgi:hypothetical protein